MTSNIGIETLPFVETGFIINPLLPVIPFSANVHESQCAEMHSHPRGQLIYSAVGGMKVILADKIWLVASGQAVWVPPMFEHQVFFINSNHIRNLFIDPSVTVGLPENCFTIQVSSFLRELILKACQIGSDYLLESPEGRIMQVLVDELKSIKPTKTFLPFSDHPSIKPIMNALIENPGDKRSLEELAELGFTTPRTVSRIFLKEVGVPFGIWRKQVRLMEAVLRLEKGCSVSQIAFELGYNSPSAFIEVFRKWYGTAPGKLLKQDLL